MKPRRHSLGLLVLVGCACVSAVASPSGTNGTNVKPASIVNPQIDSQRYLRDAGSAMAHRESRRVSEDEFIALASRPGVVIIDARSKPKYDALHVRGAVSLPFPDITVDSLERLVPDRESHILIYCNNNFADAPDPMPSKLPAAALNLATYTSLYTYGYRNVYELGPNLSVKSTRLPLVWR